MHTVHTGNDLSNMTYGIMIQSDHIDLLRHEINLYASEKRDLQERLDMICGTVEQYGDKTLWKMVKYLRDVESPVMGLHYK